MNNKSVESYFMMDCVVFLGVIVNGTVAEISRVTWAYYCMMKRFSERGQVGQLGELDWLNKYTGPLTAAAWSSS